MQPRTTWMPNSPRRISNWPPGLVKEAFDRLIGTVRRTSDEDRTRAREHLVELFGLFPPDDEQVVKARRALAAALY